jgi:hypothetical protein
LIVLCNNFIDSSSFSQVFQFSNKFQVLSKNLFTQIIFLVSQGAESLKSDIYISYNLSESAQYSFIISSGFTIFFNDLLIFAIIFVNSSPVSLLKYFVIFPSPCGKEVEGMLFSSTKSLAINAQFFV